MVVLLLSSESLNFLFSTSWIRRTGELRPEPGQEDQCPKGCDVGGAVTAHQPRLQDVQAAADAGGEIYLWEPPRCFLRQLNGEDGREPLSHPSAFSRQLLSRPQAPRTPPTSSPWEMISSLSLCIYYIPNSSRVGYSPFLKLSPISEPVQAEGNHTQREKIPSQCGKVLK